MCPRNDAHAGRKSSTRPEPIQRRRSAATAGWCRRFRPRWRRSCTRRSLMMSPRAASSAPRSRPPCAAAVQSGNDVVVSPCRMGTDDVPGDVEDQVVGLIDSGGADNPNLSFLLADTADFIATRVAQGRSVYTHCVAADTRAPAVAAAY